MYAQMSTRKKRRNGNIFFFFQTWEKVEQKSLNTIHGHETSRAFIEVSPKYGNAY